MVSELLKLLKEYGYPVRRQGSFSPTEKYPKSFFTWWNPETDDVSFYDNKEAATVWDFDVNFYSTSPELVYETIADVIRKLKEHGWIISGKGYDVASDEPTHFGRGINALFRTHILTEETRIVVYPESDYPLSINQGEPEQFSRIEVETYWK